MRSPKYLIAAIALHGLFAFAISSAAGAPANKNNQRGGKAAEHMSPKGAYNSNAQWSADPEKGWVRADERRKQRDKDNPPEQQGQRHGKPKGKGNRS